MFFKDKHAEERYNENLDRLVDIYEKIFHDALKERALNAGLSAPDWNRLAIYGLWDKYTDFFKKMHEELFMRAKNNYLDTSDLLNPSTKNLEFQITDEIIKTVYIWDVCNHSGIDPINWYAGFDLLELYHLFNNKELRDRFRKDFPLSLFKEKIYFEYDEKILVKIYEDLVNEIVGDKEIDDMLDIALSMKIPEGFLYDTLYPKLIENYNNKEKLFGTLKEYSNIICDWFNYFLEYNYHGHKNDFELLLLKIFDDYKEDIIGDEILTNFFADYLILKMRFSFRRKNGFFSKEYFDGKEYQDGVFEICVENPFDRPMYQELYLTKNKIEQLIKIFPEGKTSETLGIYSLIYLEILDRSDRENYIKELLHRMKRISGENNIIISGLKAYLNALLKSTFILDFKGEKKPEYFDEISNDLREVFGEEEFQDFENVFKKVPNASKGNENLRSHYKIGLIFGDSRSKKAFDLYSNDKKNEKEFIERQITRDQFDILAEEYYDQQNLNIEKKLETGKISFVLIFEMDHETKLRNLLPLYPDRLIVCNIPGQHFSHTQFLNMLDLGLDNFEK